MHQSKPTIPFVNEDEVSDEVKAIFQDVKEFYSLDFVPQEYLVMAHNPEILRESWEAEKALYEGKMGVDPKTVDIVGLAVASSRGCSYCINWHIAALKARGMSDREILDLTNVITLFSGWSTFTEAAQLSPDVTPYTAEQMADSPAMKIGKEEMKKAA